MKKIILILTIFCTVTITPLFAMDTAVSAQGSDVRIEQDTNTLLAQLQIKSIDQVEVKKAILDWGMRETVSL